MPDKIKDLVDIQQIVDVIDIDGFDEQGIVQDYVLTDEIHGHLNTILRRIAEYKRDAKNSVFMYGGYGSGKSHFLAFLYSVLANPELLNETRLTGLSVPPCFVVKFKASAFSNKLLEDLLFEQLQTAYQERYGEEIVLDNELLFLRNFTADSAQDAEFLAYLKEVETNTGETIGSLDVWQELIEYDREQAVEYALTFLREKRPHRQIRSSYSYRERIDKLLDALKAKEGKPVSVVVLVDELADFLDSSVERGTFRTNVSLIGELGEISARLRFHFIATLQEEEWLKRKNIDREYWNKISDRYENRSLTNVDFKRIAGERILHKKNPVRIANIYEIVRQRFPNLVFDEEDNEAGFMLIYPVHPFVFKGIDIMNNVAGTSRQRTALGYISTECQKIENQPSDTFLTVDSIYDYYFSDIEVRNKLADFHRVHTYFEENVFDRLDQDFRTLAEKTLKALIVLCLGQIEDNRPSDIADLLLYSTIEDGSLNYEIYEGLLHEMRQIGSRYLKVKTVDGQPVYYLDLQREGPSAREEIEKLKLEISDDDTDLSTGFEAVFGQRLRQENLDFGQIEVKWTETNTKRKGHLAFCKQLDGGEVEAALNRFKGDIELDFQLLISKSLENLSHLITDKRLFIWTPNAIEHARETLKEFVAITRLKNIYSENPVMSQDLASEEVKCHERLKALVNRCYFAEGVIYNSASVDVNLSEFSAERNLSDLFSFLACEPLSEKYQHPAFTVELSRTQTNSLIRDFIRHGTVKNPSPRIADYIESLALPLGIAQQKTLGADQIYDLVRAVEESPYLRDCVAIIQQLHQRTTMRELYNQVRMRFGLQEHFFEVLIYALLRKGKVVFIRNNDVYTIANLSEIAQKPQPYKYFDEIALAEELPAERLAQFCQIFLPEHRFVRKDTEELHTAWGMLFEQKKRYRKDAIGAAIEALPMEVNRQAIADALDEADVVFDFFGVVVPSPPSDIQVREQFSFSIPQLLEGKKRLDEVLALVDDKEYLVNRLHYLSQITESKQITQRNAVMERLGGAEILAEYSVIRAEIEKVIGAYISEYTAAHEQSIGGQSDFESLRILRYAPELANLKKLSRLPGIVNTADANALTAQIDAALSKECHLLSKDYLRTHPVCRCGFELSEPFSPKQIAEDFHSGLESMLKNGVAKLKEELDASKLNSLPSELRNQSQRLMAGDFDLPISDELLDALRELLTPIYEWRVPLKEFLKELGDNEAVKPELLRQRFEQFIARIPTEQDGKEVRVVIYEEE